MKGLFVTGTDTGVGKSRIAAALLYKCREQGLRTTGMKPVASGCSLVEGKLRNEDALLLQQASTGRLDYDTLNPFAFAPAIAPHIAAQQAGVTIDLQTILQCYASIAAQADVVVVEGAGGWYAPLNNHQTIADLAQSLALPIVLVVGMRLGCLNHALLSEAAIASSGQRLLGWVANTTDDGMPALQENISSLQQRMHSPCLGVVEYAEEFDPQRVANQLRLPATQFLP